MIRNTKIAINNNIFLFISSYIIKFGLRFSLLIIMFDKGKINPILNASRTDTRNIKTTLMCISFFSTSEKFL